jgi:tetratricopeptide (TPR) repeat protein
MDSLVSAVAARVVFIQGEEVSFIEAEKPTSQIPTTISAVPYLLADAYDVVSLRDTNVGESLDLLLKGWNADRALRMLDILLDLESPHDETKEAARFFSDLIANEATKNQVKNRAFAVALPNQVKLSAFVDRLDDSTATLMFVTELFEAQDKITKVRSAWEMVPDNKFGSRVDRAKFEAAAISSGVFRRLVESIGDETALKSAVLDCYLALREEPNARSIVSDWTKEFVNRPVRRKLARLEEAEEKERRDEKQFEDHGGPIHEKFTDTRKQQAGIITQLERGNVNQARRFANQLVNWQLQNGGADYAAMSLCLLAQEAKHLGQSSLQLEWVQRAIELAPDAQGHGQAGDAYLSLFRLDEAEREYAATISLGDELFGLSGLARVLRVRGKLDEALNACIEIKKRFSDHPEIPRVWALHCDILRDMWRFEDALSTYREVVSRFPEHSVFWCGVASVLKDMGNLSQALEAFSTAATRFPEEPVARGGRADTLKLLGRVDEAMKEYESAIVAFPWESPLACGKADVLRTMGRYEEAAVCYRKAMVDYPYEPIAYCGYADTKRDAGEIEEALRAYDEAILRFPSEHRCRTGRANVLRQAGRFDEALQAIDRNVRDFPYDLYSLVGRANLLKLLGLHSDALDAYQMIINRRQDYAPAKYGKAAVHISLKEFGEADRLLPKGKPGTLSEWIGFHIRGMMHMKKGELDDAIRIFEEGVQHNPFHRQRLFFETSLAAARIRIRQFSRAADLVKAGDDPVSEVLRMHSLAALGKSHEALLVYSAANDNAPPPVIHLREAVAARFGLKRSNSPPDEQWILDQETEVLLQAA